MSAFSEVHFEANFSQSARITFTLWRLYLSYKQLLVHFAKCSCYVHILWIAHTSKCTFLSNVSTFPFHFCVNPTELLFCRPIWRSDQNTRLLRFKWQVRAPLSTNICVHELFVTLYWVWVFSNYNVTSDPPRLRTGALLILMYFSTLLCMLYT
jgi:hypothetical protein